MRRLWRGQRMSPRQVLRLLVAFYALSVLILAGFAVAGAWSWGGLAVAGLMAVGATELACRLFLRGRYPPPGRGEHAACRMEPHIFTHFLPSACYPDVSKDGFRTTGTPGSGPPGARTPAPRGTIYLAGDCTVFEDHLPPEETFAYQLQARLPGWNILNAGAPHYTALHSYTRLVVDLVKGTRPDIVCFCSAANDCLAVIHHKQGAVSLDHTHLYKPWASYSQRYQRVSRWPTATLRFLLFSLLYGGKPFTWDEIAEEPSPGYAQPRSVAIARTLFDPSGFVTCLDLFRSACAAIGAELVLTTFYAHRPEMTEEPRSTYAWGIDRFNDAIRACSTRDALPLIDLADEMQLSDADITNKWHYTASGNAKRAEVVAASLIREASASRRLITVTEG